MVPRNLIPLALIIIGIVFASGCAQAPEGANATENETVEEETEEVSVQPADHPLTISVTDQDSNPLVAEVRLYFTDGTFTGFGKTTSASGTADFLIPGEKARFYVYAAITAWEHTITSATFRLSDSSSREFVLNTSAPEPPANETFENVTEEETALEMSPIDLSGFQTEKLSMNSYYSPSELDVVLNVSQYALPLETNQISNFPNFSSKISLSSEALELLERNGFAVIDNPFNSKEEYITAPYETLKDRGIPIFITTDSLLHMYHIQFDETLRQIEEQTLYGLIWKVSEELLNDSVDKYENASGDLKEALKRNAAYFAVGLSLLQPKPEQARDCDQETYNGSISYWEYCSTPDAFFDDEDLQKYSFEMPDFVSDLVESELSLIGNCSGFEVSPIFRYYEDYSQYVPRGHYTRSEKLKNYFKAFMWYGRIAFLMEKDLIKTDEPERDAKLQVMGASLIASRFAESQELKDNWDRIYSVTAFYVGLSDDLGPYEYIEALDYVFAGSFDPNLLTDENIDKLKTELGKFPLPKIYGGTGRCIGTTEECLNVSKGMRLIGQRFIPDSYIFSSLVDSKFKYTGTQEPFTMVFTLAAGPIRGFPRGLDAMAILGSESAMKIMSELNDSDYQGYDTAFNRLKEEFEIINASEWNKNLYWSWLYSLKALLREFGEGYPTFMQTQAWHDRTLTTALASWAQLRHDTVLFAKQSYTSIPVGIHFPSEPPPPPPPVVGYVEPAPEFYSRLLDLTKMTNSGLTELDVLDQTSLSRLKNLEAILGKLVSMSRKELANQELTQEEYDFIKNFGSQLNGVISDVESKAKKTTIIADVHTDSNTEMVLEEGTGYVKLIVVAYKVPDGRILAGAGPVLSYYEFKQPMDDRLTDEAWREMLTSEPPEEPEWVPNFAE